MNAISNQLPELSTSLTSNRGEQNNLKRTQFTNTAFIENKSTNLTLVTAEGDKVTFSASSTLSASQSIYTNQGLVQGIATRSTIQSFSLSESSSFEISVEGDLNAQELKDIKAAFKTIEKLSDDFFSGKADDLMASGMKIAGLESISSFEAVIQYERSASLQQATTTLDLPTPQAGKQSEESTTSTSSEQEKLGRLLDKMTEAILKTDVDLEKAAKASNKFLDRLYDKFEKHEDTAPLDLKLFRKVQSDLLEELLGKHKSDDNQTSEEIPESEAETEIHTPGTA